VSATAALLGHPFLLGHPSLANAASFTLRTLEIPRLWALSSPSEVAEARTTIAVGEDENRPDDKENDQQHYAQDEG
jgi:hypothetical protein